MEEMEEAERVRRAKIEAEDEARRVESEAKRKAVEERIERNMAMAAKIEEQRKLDFYAKQAHHEQLRAEHEQAQERDRELAAKQQDLMEQRRLMVLAQTRRDEERRREELRQSFADEEINVQRVKEARERNHMLAREKKELKTAMKLENVNRIKRIAEYKRLETLRAIHEGDKRIDTMMKRKTEIVAARKANAINVKIAKDNMVAAMEEARKSGNKATALIKQFLSPAASGPGSAMGSTGRNSKAGKKALGFGSRTAPELSAGPASPLGPKPPNESLEERFASRGAPKPGPYVSPYDLPPDPTATTTVTF